MGYPIDSDYRDERREERKERQKKWEEKQAKIDALSKQKAAFEEKK